MSEYASVCKFAAKAGALEGYLYEREKLEPLDNWVANIEEMHRGLPDGVKNDIREELGVVLKRTLDYGAEVLDEGIKTKLNNLLLAL